LLIINGLRSKNITKISRSYHGLNLDFPAGNLQVYLIFNFGTLNFWLQAG
jgi:hypothetical protein